MYAKILVANRGEIAVRIIRACIEMGIKTVAVFSEVDRDALHVSLADERICIGPAQASASYLNQMQIIRAAVACGADAIHPGYGFLSENPEFATLCEKNGIAFIGPNAELMQKVGDKAAIKVVMEDAGLPVIKGSQALATLDDAVSHADEIGYPLMLKAVSGGGGRGIRLIENEAGLRAAFPTAQAEALTAFGDGSLYLEEYIYPARHIEVQIIADEFGNVVCLGERDCSIQRRHQKLIEETPSPGVDEATRQKLYDYSVSAAKALNYCGVGTLEFLLDAKGVLHFMEMNVRLQVEHGISEMLTRRDIVKWQIRTAAGIPLDFTQADVVTKGSSIECRINATSTGTVGQLHIPGGPFVRFDNALVSTTDVTVFYDSLVGKLMVYARTREEALRKMRAALCELIVEGIETNLEEQLELTRDARFISGDYDCTFMNGR